MTRVRWLVSGLFLAASVAGLLVLAPGRSCAAFSDALRAFDAGDYTTAVREWRRLAEAGEAEAQSALAGLYLVGSGVPQDYRQAAIWYRRAARQGHMIAQLNLGNLHATGRGVARDLVLAHMWLDLAARQGSEWAAGRRDRIAKTMSAQKILEARRRAREFRRDC